MKNAIGGSGDHALKTPESYSESAGGRSLCGTEERYELTFPHGSGGQGY